MHEALAGDESLRARYLDGVALARLGRHAEALRAFADVLRGVNAAHGTPVTRARAAELDHARDLAILGIGRVYYAGRDMPAARAWFTLVHRRAPDWLDAQVGLAWVDWVDPAGTPVAERLADLRRDGAWHPDLRWVELLDLYERVDICGWDERPDRVGLPEFDRRLGEARAALTEARLQLHAVAQGNAPFESLPAELREPLRGDPGRLHPLLTRVEEVSSGIEILRFELVGGNPCAVEMNQR